jgi:hypothetical protein
VLSPLRQNGLADLLGLGVWRRGRTIIGRDARVATFAESLQQASDGAWQQAKSSRERERRFTLLSTVPEFSPERDGDRFGHEKNLRAQNANSVATDPLHHIWFHAAKLHVRIPAAQPTSR